MSTYNEERLGHVVALAKHGVGGERENATRAVKRMCEKYGLDFEEVMSDDEKLDDYEFKYTDNKLLVHAIIIAHGMVKRVPVYVHRYRKTLMVSTTKTKYIECLNALEVLIPAYRKEKRKVNKALWYGFLGKHNLWCPFPSEEDEPERKMTEEEVKARLAGQGLQDHMEDVEVRKRLG